ncbi:hypothetical protein ACQ4M4_25935 [Leptolyngbya sp. AN02str]|uniref:hypothetical protein n=1 Tax=Leptolyngbya sp. AN02str TaxID=3423363 RepID=UPI003D31F9C7
MNPLDRLKRLPWLPLLQIAGLAVLATGILEIGLWVAIAASPVVRQAIQLLFAPPLGMLMVVAIGAGLGAIAVLLLERVRRDIYITVGVLWALVGCILVMLLIRQLFPVVALPLTDSASLMGVILGVFFTARRYWR